MLEGSAPSRSDTPTTTIEAPALSPSLLDSLSPTPSDPVERRKALNLAIFDSTDHKDSPDMSDDWAALGAELMECGKNEGEIRHEFDRRLADELPNDVRALKRENFPNRDDELHRKELQFEDWLRDASRPRRRKLFIDSCRSCGHAPEVPFDRSLPLSRQMNCPPSVYAMLPESMKPIADTATTRVPEATRTCPSCGCDPFAPQGKSPGTHIIPDWDPYEDVSHEEPATPGSGWVKSRSHAREVAKRNGMAIRPNLTATRLRAVAEAECYKFGSNAQKRMVR